MWLTAVGATLVLVAVMLGGTVKAWVNQRGEIAALREQVAAQRADVKALQEEQARWGDDAYVEQQARERLKFVKPGERSYTVLDSPGEGTEVAGMASGTTSAHVPWYGMVWSSLRAADVPANARP